MAVPEKYSHIDFTPPSGARREAEYGLKLRREHGRGGTAVGIARARDLSNGVELSPSTVRRMKAYFDRHASDQEAEGFNRGDKGWPSNGYIAAKLWGGFQSGYSWAKKVVAQMNAADEKESSRSYSTDTETRSLEGKETAMHEAERRFASVDSPEPETADANRVERRYLASAGSENSTEGTLGVEHRADPQTGEKRTYLVGYAAKFHTDSLLLGDFIERIDPGAFDIVKKGKDGEGRPLETRGLFNHDPNHLIGRYPNTMSLTVDKIGLRYEILLPESRKDLAESVARGDLKGSSFSFVVAEGGEKWTREGGKSRRLVTKIKTLLDCGPVTYPAYRDSSVAVAKRSYEQFLATQERGFCPTGEGGGIDNSCSKDDGEGSITGAAAKGAAIGAAAGAATGAGAIVGAAAGAVFGALIKALKDRGVFSSEKARYDGLKKATGITDQNVTKAASILSGGGKTKYAAVQNGLVIDMNGGDEYAFVSSKSEFGDKEEGTALHVGVFDRAPDVKTIESAAKELGAKHVSFEQFGHRNRIDDKDRAAFKKAGFKEVQKGVWSKSRGGSKAKRYDELVTFLAERRGFCPTGPGGGIDNSCTPGGKDNGPPPTGGKSSGKKSISEEKPDLAAKYGVGGGTSGGKADLAKKYGFGGGIGGGKYKEWKKGDHKDKSKEKDAQDFLDKAREDQLSKGGKDGGKSDDGGGVQTWSKGEHFPWTAKQVGDNEGYVQGQHPDGSKTGKYPFKGGDTTEAYKKLADEIKAKTKKRSVDPRQVIEDTLRFLKDRR